MSENYVYEGGGGQRLMEKSILNFHFDYLTTSLIALSWSNIPLSGSGDHSNLTFILSVLFVDCLA